MLGMVIIRNITVMALLTLPLVITLMSAWYALNEFRSAQISVASWSLIALALVVTLLNFHLSYIRPMLYTKRNGESLEGYKFISGFPLIGSILAVLAVLISWGDLKIAVASLLLMIADTGGVIFLLAVLSRDRSFWRSRV